MAVKLLLLILCMTDPNQHPYLSYQTVESWLAIGIVVLLQLGAILSLLLQFSIVSIRPYIYVCCLRPSVGCLGLLGRSLPSPPRHVGWAAAQLHGRRLDMPFGALASVRAADGCDYQKICGASASSSYHVICAVSRFHSLVQSVFVA